MAPKGTPPDVVARLNAATQRVLGDAQVAQRVIAMGLQTRTSSAAEFADVLDEDLKAWRAFIALNPVAK